MSSSKDVRAALQKIPSLDKILQDIDIGLIGAPYPFIKKTLNDVLDSVREEILSDKIPQNKIKKFVEARIELAIKKIMKPSLKSVINGTGIVLNTGLGRAPISRSILDQVSDAIYPYCNLELNLETGKRGERLNHVEELLNSMVNSEKSVIVNNNAAAVMLMLNSICKGKEVIVSRGQLVEIGGSFRIPEVINSSECKMVEIGTTNKTHLDDYQNAITENTGAILLVHTSNYKVIGFTEDVKIDELIKLAKRKKIVLLFDLGSGAITDLSKLNLPAEREVKYYINKGVDVVSYSGDKLIGGAQGGILSGKKKYLNLIHKNPMYRALRCDKYRIALIEIILRTYRNKSDIDNNNLFISLINRDLKKVKSLAKKVIKGVDKDILSNNKIETIETLVEVGSGSLPTEKVLSIAISIKSKKMKPDALSKSLRSCEIPVLNYIRKDKVLIDFKAIPNEQIKVLILMINQCLK